jgi:glucose uptake protein
MILPQTYTVALLLMILGLLCLGSWVNLYKLAGKWKWRFELFYVDFAVGLMMAAVVAAFTVGNMGFDGFALTDDLIHAGRRQWIYALGAGALFNLGNMLLMAAISLGGMAPALPVAVGLSLFITMAWSMIRGAKLSLALMSGGLILILAAVVLDALAWHFLVRDRAAAAAPPPDPRKKRVKRPTALKGIILAAVAGILMAGMYPLLARASFPEVGLGPYALAFLFGFAMLVSTAMFDVFFMNLPVVGEPLEILDYVKAPLKMHLYGLAGGIVWCVGMLSQWIAGSAAPEAQLNRGLSMGLAQCYVLVAAGWGLAAWKELRGGGPLSRTMAILMVVLYALGLILIAYAFAGAPPPAA